MKTRRSNRYRKLLIRVSYRFTFVCYPPPPGFKMRRINADGTEKEIIKNELVYQRALELEKQ